MSGGVTLTMFRRGDALVPAAEMFREDLHAIPENREVVVTLKRSRSPRHLRFFFAKLRSLIRAGAWDNDQESLLDYIKIGVGHVIAVIDNTSMVVSAEMLAIAERLVAAYAATSDESRLAKSVIGLAGPKTYLVPRSISFESLDQDGFNEFDQLADRFIAEKFQIDPAQLRQQTAELAGGPAETSADAETLPGHGHDTVEDTRADEPLAKRLKDLAVDLGYRSGPDAVNARWAELKSTAEVKALYQVAPETVKIILERARDFRRGKLDETRFLAAVNFAIDGAVQGSEAA